MTIKMQEAWEMPEEVNNEDEGTYYLDEEDIEALQEFFDNLEEEEGTE